MRPGAPDAPTEAPPVGIPASPPRDVGIDRFRGALVVLMVAGNLIAGVASIPAFLKHAPDVGFTIADAVAPAFVFVVGLNFGPSFARRSAVGLASAYRHVATRSLALVGIGAIISAGAASVAGEPGDWGVLQALGIAGLLTLSVIRLPTAARFGIGIAVLAGYQVALDLGARDLVLASSHGGLLGAVSWGALLILSTAVADVLRGGLGASALCVAGLVAAAAISVALVPVSKNRVSLSYVLLTLALSAAVFLVVDIASRYGRRRPGPLAWWGENPLALYGLHLVLLSAVTVPTDPGWYAAAPVWLAAVQVVVLVAVMTLVAALLHRRELRVRL